MYILFYANVTTVTAAFYGRVEDPGRMFSAAGFAYLAENHNNWPDSLNNNYRLMRPGLLVAAKGIPLLPETGKSHIVDRVGSERSIFWGPGRIRLTESTL